MDGLKKERIVGPKIQGRSPANFYIHGKINMQLNKHAETPGENRRPDVAGWDNEWELCESELGISFHYVDELYETGYHIRIR